MQVEFVRGTQALLELAWQLVCYRQWATPCTHSRQDTDCKSIQRIQPSSV